MKKNYVSPEIKVVNSVVEGAILDHSYGWADTKKGFFDDYNEDDENVKNNDLWDKDDLWSE